MSKHVVLKTICVSILGVSFGYGLTKVMHTEYEYTNRSTASVPLVKLGMDEASFDYIDIKIDNVSLAEKKDETSLVQVHITALKDIPNSLEFKWILGKDVLTSENLEGILEPMAKGQNKIYELRVQNYSKEWQSYVSLALTGNMSGHKVKREVIVSSRPEDSFEYVVQQAALAEQQQAAQGKKLQKLNNGHPASDRFRAGNIVR